MDQEFFDKVLGPGKAENEETFLTELKTILTSNYNCLEPPLDYLEASACFRLFNEKSK